MISRFFEEEKEKNCAHHLVLIDTPKEAHTKVAGFS
jgi:hypothetical protein